MKIKKTKSEIIFETLNITLMALFCITILFPFVQQIVISFSPPGGQTQ